MKHLYFIRHGLSEMNKRGIYSGRTETPLALEGIVQAHEAAKELAKLKIDYILTSPMQRTRQTAAIIAADLNYPLQNIAIIDDLMEREFGILEGTEFDPELNVEGNEGVESEAEIMARAQRVIDYLKNLPHNNILVVSHGSVGRALRHIIDPNIPYHEAERIENAEIIKLL